MANYQNYRKTLGESQEQESDMNQLPDSQPQTNNMLYLAIDADNAGRLVGRAVLADDIQALHDISERIDSGQEIVQRWAESFGGQKISGGGDELTVCVPPEALQHIEELRSDYAHFTNLTITVGVGSKLSEAGKALLAGKARGKNTVVKYDESVEKEVLAIHDRVKQGQGSEEDQKLDEAYIDSGSSEEDPNADSSFERMDVNPPAMNKPKPGDHAPDGLGVSTDSLQEKSDESLPEKENDMDKKDNLPISEDGMEENVSRQPSFQENTPGDMGTEEDQPAEPAAESDEESVGEAAEGISEDSENEMDQENPEESTDEESQDEEDPNLSDVFQEDLNNNADGIQKEKVVDMVSHALQGFKANKEILEKAKEQAPELYQSSIAMLRAMIEMAKLLGLEDKTEDVNEIAGEGEESAEESQDGLPEDAPMSEESQEEDSEEEPSKDDSIDSSKEKGSKPKEEKKKAAPQEGAAKAPQQ